LSFLRDKSIQEDKYHTQATRYVSCVCIHSDLFSNILRIIYSQTSFYLFPHFIPVHFHRSASFYLFNEYIIYTYLLQKCFIPRDLAWRQRQMRGFSGSRVTRWVVMVMSLGGVPCSCRRIFFTQYRRKTVRHKSGLNWRVTRVQCGDRRRVKRPLRVPEKYHAVWNNKYRMTLKKRAILTADS